MTSIGLETATSNWEPVEPGTPSVLSQEKAERSRRAGCPVPDPQVFLEKDEFRSLATSSIDRNSLQLISFDVAMDSAMVPITKPTRIIE